MAKKGILVLDFGSQFNQLIARRIRQMEVYTEIHPFDMSIEKIKEWNPDGIIFSGGPNSVYDPNCPTVPAEIFELGIPILGICYGMQLIAKTMGGGVEESHLREYGKAEFRTTQSHPLFADVPAASQVWMSHTDHVIDIPQGFTQIGETDSCIAGLANDSKKIYTIQFHPEVTHSEYGEQLLNNFVFGICKANKNWVVEDFIENTVQNIKNQVGDKKVILGLSGGVDSSVAAVLIHKAIGDNLQCIFVDTGLLRQNEAETVMETYGENYKMNIKCVDAGDQFLSELAGESDPEKKRKIIGAEFIKVFDAESKKIEDASFLGQGTIYPDVIESSSTSGPSHTIKSHHNVGGLPEDMKMELVEPLRDLFKDEVRNVGRKLGIPAKMIDRHPFPGPGLGIRILGEVSPEKVEILQKADAIFIEELWKHDLYNKVSQAFVVLLPVKSVGVMGDVRTYEYTAVVRSANTIDFMTATWSKLPYEFLETVSSRIINEVKGINRVAYDISSKPPATIEWE